MSRRGFGTFDVADLSAAGGSLELSCPKERRSSTVRDHSPLGRCGPNRTIELTSKVNETLVPKPSKLPGLRRLLPDRGGRRRLQLARRSSRPSSRARSRRTSPPRGLRDEKLESWLPERSRRSRAARSSLTATASRTRRSSIATSVAARVRRRASEARPPGHVARSRCRSRESLAPRRAGYLTEASSDARSRGRAHGHWVWIVIIVVRRLGADGLLRSRTARQVGARSKRPRARARAASVPAERHGPGGPAGLQNSCGRVTHGSVGSTPAPLRSTISLADGVAAVALGERAPPPMVIGSFHGRHPWFCAVAGDDQDAEEQGGDRECGEEVPHAHTLNVIRLAVGRPSLVSGTRLSLR